MCLEIFPLPWRFSLRGTHKIPLCQVRRIRWVADFQHPVIHHNFGGASVMILFHTPGRRLVSTVAQLRNTVLNPNCLTLNRKTLRSSETSIQLNQRQIRNTAVRTSDLTKSKLNETVQRLKTNSQLGQVRFR